MPDISIRADLFPFRFNLKDKKPLELKVEIKNEGKEVKKVSLDLLLPYALGFDKACSNRNMQRRIEEMKPGEKVTIVQPVFLSATAGEGAFNGKVRVQEHWHDFGYVLHNYSKDIVFRVLK